jgi:hypothetical protein
MRVQRAALTVGTIVAIIADRTLVASATDVGWVGFVASTQRAIAADAHMNGRHLMDGRKLLVNRNEAVSWVSNVLGLDAFGAIVPIGAVEALVTNTNNILIAAIADSKVLLATAGGHLGLNMARHLSALDGRREAMHGMMAVGILGEARLAQIIVLTSVAVKELVLRKLLDTAVAGPHDTQGSPSGNKGFE